MRTWRHILLMLVSLTACSAISDVTADSAAIRALATQQAEAWNRHDAKAYAGLFTADCDVVNVLGQWWSGRTDVERKLTMAYASTFKDSALTFTDVQARFLSPELAVVHMRWTMTGAAMPSGQPQPKQGIQTLVVRKQDGKWLISVFQNTNAAPGDECRCSARTAASRPSASSSTPVRNRAAMAALCAGFRMDEKQHARRLAAQRG